MPRYLTIGYGDQAGYGSTPTEVRDAAHEHDTRLIRNGTITSVLSSPVRVTNKHEARHGDPRPVPSCARTCGWQGSR